MAFAVYEQNTGLFLIMELDDGGNERVLEEFRGYAGRGIHKNKAKSEGLKSLGPLPAGDYRVNGPFDHARLGPVAFNLAPFKQERMHGRSGFMVHGDSRLNPGDASRGCIVLPRPAREAIEHYKVRLLEVYANAAV